jgi:HEAT repeat protein
MAINTFETQLTGGHPNSLGNTEEVVRIVLKNHDKLQDLYNCYKSEDAVVRLRVSSAMKRICKARPEWIMEYLDRFQSEVSKIDQPSAKWSLAQMFMWLDEKMSDKQRERAIKIMQHNLETDDDWIVQNNTAESLAYFATTDARLREWLIPQLEKMKGDRHNSVARRAHKLTVHY